MSGVIELEQVGKRFGRAVSALERVSLSVDAGEFVSIVGPSGCGKSTLLKLIAGLEAPTDGAIRLAERPGEAGMPPISFVFQEPTLMPWATVFDNVWLPLRLAGRARGDARERIDALLRTVGLEGFGSAYPRELSGGMKMRVSIARALVSRPWLLLMDEPFAALDEITRERLNDDLLGWWRERQLTTLFVTHNVYEAVYLSQRVLVMSSRPGTIVAQVSVEAPYPRDEGFRTSPAYALLCGEVSRALRAAGQGEGR